MLRGPLAAAAFLCLSACQNSEVKVLIGATAVVAPNAQPIEDSVVVIAGRRIRSVGFRKDIPIPQDSQRTDLAGKWIVPAEGARIAIGEQANVLVLNRAPHDVQPGSESDVSRRLINGDWQR